MKTTCWSLLAIVSLLLWGCDSVRTDDDAADDDDATDDDDAGDDDDADDDDADDDDAADDDDSLPTECQGYIFTMMYPQDGETEADYVGGVRFEWNQQPPDIYTGMLEVGGSFQVSEFEDNDGSGLTLYYTLEPLTTYDFEAGWICHTDADEYLDVPLIEITFTTMDGDPVS